jgi:hypothetical protein
MSTVTVAAAVVPVVPPCSHNVFLAQPVFKSYLAPSRALAPAPLWRYTMAP